MISRFRPVTVGYLPLIVSHMPYLPEMNIIILACQPKIVNVYWQYHLVLPPVICKACCLHCLMTPVILNTWLVYFLIDKVIAKVNQNELDRYENFFNTAYAVSKNILSFTEYTYMYKWSSFGQWSFRQKTWVNFIKTISEVLHNYNQGQIILYT